MLPLQEGVSEEQIGQAFQNLELTLQSYRVENY